MRASAVTALVCRLFLAPAAGFTDDDDTVDRLWPEQKPLPAFWFADQDPVPRGD
jgi:hypothetical protein